jgi:hypothetical protein
MRFNLFANDELIGSSKLEKDDESMGVRSGRFYPNENYHKLQPLFRQYSTITNCDLVEYDRRRAEIELFRRSIEALRLRIETKEGMKVGVRHVELTDYSAELGDEGYELTIVVDDRRTYEEFFL